MRLLVSYLAVANVFFLATFLFFSPSSELVAGATSVDVGDVDVPRPAGPVVLVVLDELPAATIMRGDGTLNDERYPGFAELASVSTWYRNASSQYNLTHRAVPALLDGSIADADDLPTYTDHPRNLFTLLGAEVPVRRYESVTDMCPPEVCAPPPRQPLGQAFEDASIVYGHRVLPGALRDDLPAIDNSWGSYGAADEPDDDLVRQVRDATDDASTLIGQAYAKWQGLAADERSPLGQAGILREEIAAITGEPALHVVHVALPHRPWMLTRTGRTLSFEPELIREPDAPGYDFAARMEYQLHSMQVGAADTLVGELVDHLRSLPSWEDTTLVVTSDHGTNLTAPDIGRMDVTDANREEVYRVPLFVKAPGQVEGAIDDQSAQTIDVLPSLIDLLDADVDWEMDGHSLYDGSEATVEPKVSTDVADVLAIAAGARRGVPARRRLDRARRRRRPWRPRRQARRRPRRRLAVDVDGPPRPGRAVRRPADRRRRAATRARRIGRPPGAGQRRAARAARRGERNHRRRRRRLPARRRALAVHRLRRRPLPRRRQRGRAVRGARRRRRRHPAPRDVMSSANSSTASTRLGMPFAR